MFSKRIIIGLSYLQLPTMKPNKLIIVTGAKGDLDFRISDLVKNPDGTDI